MANILPRERQLAVLHLLAEGSSIRAAERVSGIHRDTICRLVVRFGEACREWLDKQMQGLTVRHLELDEQWTYVGKKQARLTVDEKQSNAEQGDIYLWIGVDQDTRLVPSFALGKRSADMARRFMVDIAGRLTRPAPHASDAHGYQAGAISSASNSAPMALRPTRKRLTWRLVPMLSTGSSSRNTATPGCSMIRAKWWGL